MRLLLDESVPRRLRRHLPDHEVKTVVEMGWGGFKNGALLARVGNGFDAFVTVDKSLSHQQYLGRLPVAVVLLSAVSNELRVLIQLLPELEEAPGRLQPCSFVRVGAV